VLVTHGVIEKTTLNSAYMMTTAWLLTTSNQSLDGSKSSQNLERTIFTFQENHTVECMYHLQ